MKHVGPAIYTFFCGALFLFSLCNIAFPDNGWAWMWALAVGELLGHWLILPALLLAVLGWRKRPAYHPGAFLVSLAAIVFALPLCTAIGISARLPAELTRVWPEGVKATPAPPLTLTGTIYNGENDLEPLMPDRYELPSGQPIPYTAETFKLPQVGDKARLYVCPNPRRKYPREAPCILTVHTGSWESGDPEEFPEWVVHWLHRGYAVASLDYRLAPGHPWPAQLDDVRAALDFLTRQRELGIDPSRIVLLGRSAGAQIAMAAAYREPPGTIRGVISLYGPMDLIFADLYKNPLDILDTDRLLTQYMGGNSDLYWGNYVTASPLYQVRADSPPTLLVHGRRDTLVWCLQSRRMDKRLAELGVPHYFLDIPWGVHGLDYPTTGLSSQLVRYSEDVFLQDVFR